MKVAISGSSGLVGIQLRKTLQANFGAEVVSIPRDLLYGDVNQLSSFISGCNVIVNLAGATIASRWTKKRKQILRESRIVTTQNLKRAIDLLPEKPELFISTSAVGIYSSEGIHDEDSHNYADDFLGKLCQEWEDAAKNPEMNEYRTVIFRLGLVISKDGGVLQKMLPIFRLGLGGRLGDGRQPFPFIHISDLMNAYQHVITHKNLEGTFNLVAPELVTNSDFTKIVSSYVNTPAFFSVPAFLLRLILLEGASALLTGQKVVADRLIKENFSFFYSTLQKAVFSLNRRK